MQGYNYNSKKYCANKYFELSKLCCIVLLLSTEKPSESLSICRSKCRNKSLDSFAKDFLIRSKMKACPNVVMEECRSTVIFTRAKMLTAAIFQREQLHPSHIQRMTP